MIGRIIGGALGAAAGRGRRNSPIAGAVIGAGTMFAARRLFPARYAALAATATAAYLTKKWAERQVEEREARDISRAMSRSTPPVPPAVKTPQQSAAEDASSKSPTRTQA